MADCVKGEILTRLCHKGMRETYGSGVRIDAHAPEWFLVGARTYTEVGERCACAGERIVVACTYAATADEASAPLLASALSGGGEVVAGRILRRMIIGAGHHGFGCGRVFGGTGGARFLAPL